MENYSFKPNSRASKEKDKNEEPEKNVQTIVTSEVKIRKRGAFRKFFDMFITDEAENVGEYLLKDVLVPTLKRGMYDMITNGLDMMLFGGRGNGGSKRTISSTVSYNKKYQGERRTYTDHDSDEPDRLTYRDVILPTRQDAEDVLENMRDLITRYQVVSILDFYELVGMNGTHTDNKYGWTSLRSVPIERVRGGYILNLPRAMPID